MMTESVYGHAHADSDIQVVSMVLKKEMYFSRTLKMIIVKVFVQSTVKRWTNVTEVF
jgi:hypothetical protein